MYKLWDKKTNLVLPNGVSYTPEQIKDNPSYGFSKYNDVMIQTCGEITVGIDNVPLLLSNFKLDENLRGQAAIDAILDHMKKMDEQAEAQADMAQEGYINTLYATIAYANKDLNLDEEATKKAISDCVCGRMMG